jgi:hypothetical protein
MTDDHEDLHPVTTGIARGGFMTDTLTVDTGVAELPDEPDRRPSSQGPDLRTSTTAQRPASRRHTTSRSSSASTSTTA